MRSSLALALWRRGSLRDGKAWHAHPYRGPKYTGWSWLWTTQAMRCAQQVPSLGIPQQTRGIVDLYDASTDWIPIYDRSSLPGFYMACGSSGNQYKNAPIAGKLMAALVDYCEAGNDHDNSPMQFVLPYVGTTVSSGFYTRKREFNMESSFSVVE